MNHITLEQRYVIARMLSASKSVSEIALAIAKHKSSVYREIKRNAKQSKDYDPDLAHSLSQRRHHIKLKHKAFTQLRKDQVDYLLTSEQYSPEQIKGFCDRVGYKMVSHETIYLIMKV